MSHPAREKWQIRAQESIVFYIPDVSDVNLDCPLQKECSIWISRQHPVFHWRQYIQFSPPNLHRHIPELIFAEVFSSFADLSLDYLWSPFWEEGPWDHELHTP